MLMTVILLAQAALGQLRNLIKSSADVCNPYPQPTSSARELPRRPPMRFGTFRQGRKMGLMTVSRSCVQLTCVYFFRGQTD